MSGKEQLPARKVPVRNVPVGRQFGAGVALPTLQRVRVPKTYATRRYS